MADTVKTIRGDLDGVYNDANATCHLIRSFILSKGDLKTNSLSNKFCNVEILKGTGSNTGLYYFVTTSGRLGADNNNATVRRVNSERVASQLFLDECKKRAKEGYTQVDVVSIYPNCSACAKNFVSEKNIMSKEEAKEIKNKSKVDIELPKIVKKETDFNIDKEVARFVKNVYYEANQSVKKSISPAAFQNKDNLAGVLNIKMIARGRDILKEISLIQNKLAVAKRNRNALMESIANLSNMYNSTIPRVLKSGSTEWLLDTGEKLLEQYELLDILELTLSHAVLNTTIDSNVESQYQALNSDIKLVTDTKILNDIKEKMKIEQLGNHHFSTRLLNVFEINQKNAPAFDGSCGNVVSLFHGTRAANLFGILSTHIKLPQNLGSNIQMTGHMFGYGCYFGEYSKALQYSTARFGGTQNKLNKYYIMLCDVALGRAEFLTSPCSYASAKRGYNSVMGVGERAFTSGCYLKGIGGTKDFKIPANVFRESCGRYSQLINNEFIVYNQNRFRIRYVVEVEAR
jgi:hypothetical protein